MQEVDSVITVRASNMDVLTKYRRLLNQITEVFQRTLVARIVAHLLALPLLKRVRAPATDFKMVVCGSLQNHLLHGGELRRRLVNVAADSRRHLKHAFGDIVLHFSGGELGFDGVNQGGRVLA